MTTNYGVAISMPFRFGNVQGSVSGTSVTPGTGGTLVSTSDPRIIWKDRVFVALLTGLRERVLRPDYGTTITSSLFETESQAIASTTDSIRSTFAAWLPSLKLKNLRVTYDSTTGQLNIDVEYVLPDDTVDVFATQVKTTTFDQYGTVIRESA